MTRALGIERRASVGDLRATAAAPDLTDADAAVAGVEYGDVEAEEEVEEAGEQPALEEGGVEDGATTRTAAAEEAAAEGVVVSILHVRGSRLRPLGVVVVEVVPAVAGGGVPEADFSAAFNDDDADLGFLPRFFFTTPDFVKFDDDVDVGVSTLES